eukprot:TRINITY_DN5534_c0_g1_i12.p1 TRINITY_DN5534_c0_g1~~TRINITY_DN5534_c0_g1_i12.p1  ORF type:complete len:312 (+),score=86.87 TRINITY_DN5534_c0_g1_i12:69-1004(+)
MCIRDRYMGISNIQMGAQESKNREKSEAEQEEGENKEHEDESEEGSKKKKKKTDKEKNKANDKKKGKVKATKKVDEKISPVKKQVIDAIEASKDQKENTKQAKARTNVDQKTEERAMSRNKNPKSIQGTIYDTKENEDKNNFINIVRDGKLTASDQKLISTQSKQFPSKYQRIKHACAASYSRTRRNCIPEVNHTPSFLSKALHEKTAGEYMGFSKHEDLHSSLVKLQFPDLMSKKRVWSELDQLYVEDLKSVKVESREKSESPAEYPLSLFLRDLDGNLAKSGSKQYITSIRKNSMSLYGQYIMRTILKT